MILARYVANRYLRAFLLLAGVFLAILLLIDMVEQIRRFADNGITLGDAAELSALAVAGSFYTILPLIGLLAAIMLFLALSRSSEMVAIRASGRSALRVVAAPAVMAALIGIFAVAVLNPMVAATEFEILGRYGAHRIGHDADRQHQRGRALAAAGDGRGWRPDDDPRRPQQPRRDHAL